MTKRLTIPQVIRDAVHNALASYPVAANTGHAAEIACEAFARVLAEHPIVPTEGQWAALVSEWKRDKHAMEVPSMEDIYPLWATHMFDAPEPEVPEEIKDMLLDAGAPDSEHCFFKPSVYNERIQEAYRRGKESREP